MITLEVDPARAIRQLRELASIGRCGTGVDRRTMTGSDVEARRWLAGQMRAAGLETHVDAVGNVIGRTRHPRRVLIGSHSDTVPRGGWLDGALGVIAGLEIARAVQRVAGDSALGVEAVSFADEEGHFSPLLGSRTFCGEMSAEAALAACNSTGESLREAIGRSGLEAGAAARLDPDQHVAFLELHIEQGPVLEAAGEQIGIVTDIVGIRLDEVEFSGTANHAGTTPMSMRRDAAAALFEFANRWLAACREHAGPSTVWNLGHVEVDPGAHNVVANRAFGICQYRDVDQRRLDRIAEALRSSADAAARAANVSVEVACAASIPPTPMAPDVIDRMEAAVRRLGYSYRRMPSGAGHDAMIVGRYVPAGMLFVPSRGGVSHSTDEDTSDEQLARGIEALARTVEAMIEEQAAR